MPAVEAEVVSGAKTRCWPLGFPGIRSARGVLPSPACGKRAVGEGSDLAASSPRRRGGPRCRGPPPGDRPPDQPPFSCRPASSATASGRRPGCRWRTRDARADPRLVYLKDEWAKQHPIFEGLPPRTDGLHLLSRDHSRRGLAGPGPAGEAVAGAIKASQDYSSGLMVAVHRLGAGAWCSTRCESARTSRRTRPPNDCCETCSATPRRTLIACVKGQRQPVQGRGAWERSMANSRDAAAPRSP